MTRRTERLNSLLREVISEVIRKDVKNPHIDAMTSITRADITKDLHYAKVYVSVIGDQKKKDEALAALNNASGFIAVNSSKKVVMRYFPELTFILDDSADTHAHIASVIHKIQAERESREVTDESE